MATHQLTYVCGGICGVDSCPRDFNTETELTMHCTNEDETQVHTNRPFCGQCFMIFDEMDNPVAHECDVGKAQAQISMALSQCDTTIIDLTLGGNIGDDFCSFRNEDWYLSKAPQCPDSSRLNSSSSEEGIMDDTIIPVAAAKKRRKSLQDASPVDNKRKSPRLDAQRREAALPPNPPVYKSLLPVDTVHGDLDNVVIAGSFKNIQTIISPIRFKAGTFQTSSVAKQNNYMSVFETKQTRKTQKKPNNNKPITRAVSPVSVQQPPIVPKLPTAAAANVAPSAPEPMPRRNVIIKKSKSDTHSDPISVPGKVTQDSAVQKDPTSSMKPRVLENVGIFWDIENIDIPSNISVSLLVRKIRNTFVTMDKREVEFMCVCDVHKEKRYMINELNSCNVTIVHVSCYSKNAADEKLKHYLNRFAQTYSSPSTAVLLSGDVNFGDLLSNLTRFYGLHTVLIHNPQCSSYLKEAASRIVLFEDFIKGIGPPQKSVHSKPCFLLAENLPIPRLSYSEVYNRLGMLCDNTGGKTVNIRGTTGLLQFTNMELCVRAQKRLNGFKFRQMLPPIIVRFSPGM